MEKYDRSNNHTRLEYSIIEEVFQLLDYLVSIGAGVREGEAGFMVVQMKGLLGPVDMMETL